MMEVIFSIVIFLVMILLLVGIHELGHFGVALATGVPVRCFSIGFGKPLFKWYGKSGIEYRLAWLPLGGYVKLIDERESLSPRATVKRQVGKRLLVVLAGPFANFLLALVAFYFMGLAGRVYIKPVIGQIAPQSIAQQAGLQEGEQIIKVNDQTIFGWQGVKLRLLRYLGEAIELPVTVLANDSKQKTYQLNLSQWQINAYRPQLLSSLGITPKLPKPGQQWPPSLLISPQFNVLSAVPHAFHQFELMFGYNIEILYKLLTAKLPLTILAGPVTLFKTAEIAVEQGTAVFWEILGILSIGLGLINLLPIPGLDGSHVIYLLIEKARGHSFSIAFEVLLFKLGIICISLLMAQVIANDLVRWFVM